MDLVYRVLTQTPPGRFIESLDNEFYVVDYDRAVEKTCQALREKKSQPPPDFKNWEKEQKKAKRRAVVKLKHDHDVERVQKRRKLVQLDQQKTSSPTANTTVTINTTACGSQEQIEDPGKVSATIAPTDEPKSPQAQRPKVQQLLKRRPLPMMLSSNVARSNKSSDSEGIYFDYTVPKGQTQTPRSGDTRELATTAALTQMPEVVAATVSQELPLSLSMSSPSASFFLQLRLEELRNRPPPPPPSAATRRAVEESSPSSDDVTAKESDVAFILSNMGSIQHC